MQIAFELGSCLSFMNMEEKFVHIMLITCAIGTLLHYGEFSSRANFEDELKVKTVISFEFFRERVFFFGFLEAVV